MKITPALDFKRETLEVLLSSIPFYKAVKAEDPAQFEMLLQHSRIIYCDPGSVVLSKGDIARRLYFLIKGRLRVFSGSDTVEGEQVNHITPGEVFGDVSMLLNQPRNASISVDNASQGAVLFSTEFSAFGDLEDCSLLSLNSKLLFYRNTVLSLRWKLEVYSTHYPQSSLSGGQRQIKAYVGEKGSLKELQALHREGVELAKLLQAWNTEVSLLNDQESDLPSEKATEIAPNIAAQF